MVKKTLKCYKCKEDTLREEIVAYASPNAKVLHNYCPKCLAEKQANDLFKLKVFLIFGKQANWSRINKDRNRLIDTYGYTDNIITDCLDYLYNVKKLKVLSSSLALVTPKNVEEMKKYKREETSKAGVVTAAAAVKIKEYSAPIQENKSKPKEQWNFEDWL